MINFDQESKIRAVMAFIGVMYETAGCSANEIKRLLHPKVINATIRICNERAALAKQGGQP